MDTRLLSFTVIVSSGSFCEQDNKPSIYVNLEIFNYIIFTSIVFSRKLLHREKNSVLKNFMIVFFQSFIFSAFTSLKYEPTVAYPGILLGGGVQQILLRTDDRDLEAVAP